ncbi:metallophosphoesterase family protein [Tengunoibacter tsumagoiensis]|uniref:Calcineurin-like phosphoesterase domain-containing protein n=1 Tax=Tengunoibacter tsumagoiensis TaxID=2014871 RepID=A0A401ZYA5_9CHLR|nr:metallophosphoesterase family protein [Tengunoibacter tsumagoiensis]GCE11829.1 hypothetical protein KTT_16880 [Tengunoibacter tsumagoiensis]
MRYAIFTDIHANLEALEAVLAKIDELSQQEPVDQIWFLGDLVGYGPNPNECIEKLRERTDVIIAGNHDWAAVGKIDLEDFSEAARISALWTREQLTEEHRTFLANLPERLEKDECLLVHGSPYGPLWEYLTSEVLAERSFQYFSSRFCFVGHTHVPVIFQQPDSFANTPTQPLDVEAIDVIATHGTEEANRTAALEQGASVKSVPDEQETQTAPADETVEQSTSQTSINDTESVHTAPEALQEIADRVDVENARQQHLADDAPELVVPELAEAIAQAENEEDETAEVIAVHPIPAAADVERSDQETPVPADELSAEEKSAEELLNEEIEELLALLGLSQSMVEVTNEMLVPPEGAWKAPEGYRAIINPGGVGQPRDGDARAAFMIYDTEKGFTFYRVSYSFEKTQEKIIEAKLPNYLATRLAYGR